MRYDFESLLHNKEFPDYTFFTETMNALYFQYLLPFLNQEVNSEQPLFAAIEHFEELVSENVDLQYEYVELYHEKNEFYLTQRSDGSKLYDIYILARNNKVVMFFIRKALWKIGWKNNLDGAENS